MNSRSSLALGGFVFVLGLFIVISGKQTYCFLDDPSCILIEGISRTEKCRGEDSGNIVYPEYYEVDVELATNCTFDGLFVKQNDILSINKDIISITC